MYNRVIMKYIVKLSKPLFNTGIYITYYINRITSYKRKMDGIILSMSMDKEHRYTTEKAAQKAALAYNGKVMII